MSIAALFALVAVAAAPPPAKGVELASARVGVEIVQPVMVRQASGLELPGEDSPRPQVSRREGVTLFEFQ